MRAKATQRQHRHTKHATERATKFGELLTADHAYSHREALKGVTGTLDELVLYDVGTDILAVYPAASKNAQDTEASLVRFIGNREVKRIYTDGAKELSAAIKKIGIAPVIHDKSTPGVPQTNGIAEGCVKRVVYGARTLLVSAGLPHPYWDLAAECFCFLRNTQITNGNSPWHKLHDNGHFPGHRLPFGALVHFIPAATIKRRTPTKHDPNAVPGIFLGYAVSGGNTWNKQYRIAMLDDFAGRNFHRSCSWADHSFSYHTVGEVWPDKEIKFPLRALGAR